MELTRRHALTGAAGLAAAAGFGAQPARAQLTPGKPFAGQTVKVMVVRASQYAAQAKRLPAFEAETGIKVQFIDVPFEPPAESSLDLTLSGPGGLLHNLMLFQEGGTNDELDLRIWFDELTVRRPDGEPIPLKEFSAGGRRWWDALHNGDPRTAGSEIVSAK